MTLSQISTSSANSVDHQTTIVPASARRRMIA